METWIRFQTVHFNSLRFLTHGQFLVIERTREAFTSLINVDRLPHYINILEANTRDYYDDLFSVVTMAINTKKLIHLSYI